VVAGNLTGTIILSRAMGNTENLEVPDITIGRGRILSG
jgi:hypothetical protein